MHMRMKPQLAVVCVQHGQRAGYAAQVFVVLAEGLERVPGVAHQGFIDGSLVRPGQGAKLRGQREGEQKVGGGHPAFELALQPDRALVVLAVRAGAVAARVRKAGLRVTARAGREHAARKAGAAGLERSQGLALAGQQACTMALQQLGLELRDQVGQAHHDRAPGRVPVAAVMPLGQPMR